MQQIFCIISAKRLDKLHKLVYIKSNPQGKQKGSERMKLALTTRFSSYFTGLGYYFSAGFFCCVNPESNAKSRKLKNFV